MSRALSSSFTILLLGASWLAAQTAPPDYLLPKDVIPKKHTIEMTIDPSQSSFSGVARIEVQVLKPQSVIWVNGKGLTVQSASIEIGKTSETVKTETAGDEFIGLEAPKPVPAGKAVLVIHYQAPLSEQNRSGPFSRHFEDNWYMFTVFTPIDARRAFPCFDQPNYKTPWDMSIQVKATDKAYANGPVEHVIDEPNGMKLYQFKETQPLPAEVVAFAVGPFDDYDGGTAGAKNTPIHIIVPKGHGPEGHAAATVLREILPNIEHYTGIPYPYDKLYLIDILGGAFGATEDPGLITFSRGLRITPDAETPQAVARLKGTITHETCHQWFGDGVTQSTWEDVYLSEGFATWLTFKMGDLGLPPEQQHLSAVAGRERIMITDAGPQTHPVRFTMKNRKDLDNVYNQMAYQKGAGILMMLDGWLGADKMQKGLQDYLRAHLYGNADTDILAADLRKGSGIDVSVVMHSFLDQTGVPIVHADVQCDSGKAKQIVLEQTGSPQTWSIPVCWTGDGMTRACAALSTARREVALKQGGSCPAWMFANAGGTGYYRLEWTPAQLSVLASSGLSKLNDAERLTFVNDLNAEQKAGHIDASVTEPIFKQLTSDTVQDVSNAAKQALGMPVEGGRGRGRGRGQN